MDIGLNFKLPNDPILTSESPPDRGDWGAGLFINLIELQ